MAADVAPGTSPEPHPGAVLAALADRNRLRVFAALVLSGPATPEELSDATGVDGAVMRRALGRLAAASLVSASEGTWDAKPDGLSAAARLGSRLVVAPDAGEGARSPEEAAVLRAYVVGGRLRAIPAVRHKRLVILDWLSQKFEPGELYPEAEVNRILSRSHADAAALRRFLVDEDLMTRRQGFYWRSGGTFDLD